MKLSPLTLVQSHISSRQFTLTNVTFTHALYQYSLNNVHCLSVDDSLTVLYLTACLMITICHVIWAKHAKKAATSVECLKQGLKWACDTTWDACAGLGHYLTRCTGTGLVCASTLVLRCHHTSPLISRSGLREISYREENMVSMVPFFRSYSSLVLFSTHNKQILSFCYDFDDNEERIIIMKVWNWAVSWWLARVPGVARVESGAVLAWRLEQVCPHPHIHKSESWSGLCLVSTESSTLCR